MDEDQFRSGAESLIAGALAARLRRTSTDPGDRQFDESPDTQHLSRHAAAFMQGATYAAQTRLRGPVHAELALVDAEERGFAYEGAAMTAFMLDRLTPGRRWRVPLLLCADGHGFRYLVHVGVGWGMARLGLRLPRTSWGLDPLLRWLALDGRGFHDSFFANPTDRDRMHRAPVTCPTEHITGQGMGRALWFVHGAQVDRISATVRHAHPTRRNAMWAGVGLAAAYAGSARAEPVGLKRAAGPHAPAVHQGMTFGHAARVAQGLPPPGRLVDDSHPDQSLARAVALAAPLTTWDAGAEQFRAWQLRLEEVEPSALSRPAIGRPA